MMFIFKFFNSRQQFQIFQNVKKSLLSLSKHYFSIKKKKVYIYIEWKNLFMKMTKILYKHKMYLKVAMPPHLFFCCYFLFKCTLFQNCIDTRNPRSLFFFSYIKVQKYKNSKYFKRKYKKKLIKMKKVIKMYV